MRNEELFYALAYVEPEYLEHSENMKSRRVRPAVTGVLIAAVVCVITCTALAVPVLRNYIAGLREEKTNISAVYVSPSGETMAREGLLDVALDLTLSEDTPKVIETFYVPLWLAENWTAQEQTRYEYQVSGIRRDTLLIWENGKGGIVHFQQNACPGYNGYPYETISIGFDCEYTNERVTFGGTDLWCIQVSSSEAVTEDAVVKAEGFRKFYWSDGSYIFTLQANEYVTDEELNAIFSSLSYVEDISAYENIVLAETPELTQAPLQQTVLQPKYIPDGMELQTAVVADGCYEYYWARETESGARVTLELLQRTDWDEGSVAYWETMTAEHTKDKYTIHGWDVTVYASDIKREAFWQTDFCNYVMTSRGPEPLAEEEFIAVIESLEAAKDVSS